MPTTEIEVDELHTYVGHKANAVWVWMALCRHTRLVIAYHVGLRRVEDADGPPLRATLAAPTGSGPARSPLLFGSAGRLRPNHSQGSSLLPGQSDQSSGAVQQYPAPARESLSAKDALLCQVLRWTFSTTGLLLQSL